MFASVQSATGLLMDIERNTGSGRIQHIENRRIVDLVYGHLRLQEWEQDHLHVCEVCQGVVYVLVDQQARPEAGKEGKLAGGAA